MSPPHLRSAESSEQYMTREKELAHNTIIIFIGKICTQSLSFLLLPLYTSILSTQEYGTTEIYATCQMLIICVLFAQIEQAVFRFIIDNRTRQDGKETIISTTLAFFLFQTMLLLLLFIFAVRFTDIEYGGLLLLNTIGSALSAVFLQTARGLGDNTGYAKGSFICAGFTMAFHVYLITVVKAGAAGILLGNFCGYLISSVYLFFRLRFYGYLHIRRIRMTELKELLGYSLPLVPNALSWWLVSASDRIIVSLFLGSSMSGILSVSQKFSTVYSNMYTMFNMAWCESASVHMGEQDQGEFFRNVITNAFYLFSSIALGIIAVMPFLFKLLVRGAYEPAFYQIPIYLLSAFFNVIQGLYSVVYIALKKTKKLAKSTVMAAVINLAVNLALIGRLGLYAASISSVVSYAVISMFRYRDVNQYIGVRLEKKAVIMTVLAFTVVFASYYLGSVQIKAAVFFCVCVYSVLVNRTFVRGIFGIGHSLLSKIKV